MTYTGVGFGNGATYGIATTAAQRELTRIRRVTTAPVAAPPAGQWCEPDPDGTQYVWNPVTQLCDPLPVGVVPTTALAPDRAAAAEQPYVPGQAAATMYYAAPAPDFGRYLLIAGGLAVAGVAAYLIFGGKKKKMAANRRRRRSRRNRASKASCVRRYVSLGYTTAQARSLCASAGPYRNNRKTKKKKATKTSVVRKAMAKGQTRAQGDALWKAIVQRDAQRARARRYRRNNRRRRSRY